MDKKDIVLQEYLFEKLKGTLLHIYSFKTYRYELETFKQFYSRKTNPTFRAKYKIKTKRQ